MPLASGELRPPHPLTRGSAPGPRWGHRPQTPIYARAPALAAFLAFRFFFLQETNPACETLMSAKQTINDKLQGSVATYLRCVGVVITKFKKGFLLVDNFFFKSVNIWQSYKQDIGNWQDYY